MSNQGQGLLGHFYQGFVCFVLILGSGELLQDDWFSGYTFPFALFKKVVRIKEKVGVKFSKIAVDKNTLENFIFQELQSNLF